MVFQEALQAALAKGGVKTAIEYDKRIISYKELQKVSGKVTSFLLKNGVGKGTVIGICLADRIELISAMIGVINAGCVFVLIDESWPEARTVSIVRDLALEHLIGSLSGSPDRGDHLGGKDGGCLQRISNRYFLEEITRLEDNQAETTKLEDNQAAFVNELIYEESDALYIYYTSGSTGRPKGIIGKNASLLHFLQWEIDTLGPGEGCRSSQFISPFFDAFLRDVFVPLLAGGTLCIPPPQEYLLQSRNITDWMNAAGIQLVHCVPSLFRLINNATLTVNDLPHLKYVLLSGEKINPAELIPWYERFGDRIQLYNLYGPSETTMIRTCYPIMPADAGQSRIPIGQPIRDSMLLILDKDRKPCQLMVPGEIYLSTAYSTLGYLNAPEMTKERFVTIPTDSHGPLTCFRTGDIARRLPGGKMDLIGRDDRQIKLRGIRIEPDEIEMTMLRSGLIKGVVVAMRPTMNGEDMLTAYVTVTEQKQDWRPNLRYYLENTLPAYMLPSEFVLVNEFPLLGNGKIDHLALISRPVDKEIVPAEGETQQALLAVWKSILGDKPVSAAESFHAAGGSSLAMMQLISRINKEFDVRISLSQLFQHPTIRDQARLIGQLEKKVLGSILPAPQQRSYPLSAAQQRIWLLSQTPEGSKAYHMPAAYEIKGMLDVHALEVALEKVLVRHEILRTVFREEQPGKVSQVVLPAGEIGFRLLVTDMRGGPEIDPGKVPGFDLDKVPGKEDMIRQWVNTAIREPFNLETGPLVRAAICRVDENKWIYLFNMHHIISDLWSIDIFFNELMQGYKGSIDGKDEGLTPLAIQYKDYVHWLEQQHSAELFNRSRSFWLGQFEGTIPVLDLPTDKRRPLIKTYNGAVIHRPISPVLTGRLRQLCKQQDSTLFMGLLAATCGLLYRYTGQNDIIAGSPVAGRAHPDLENQLGLYVNTLALRIQFEKGITFSALLAIVKQTTVAAFENQLYPFDELIDALRLRPDRSRNPLFDVMIGFQDTGVSLADDSRIPGLDINGYAGSENTVSKFDLTILFAEEGDGLRFSVGYNSDLFERSTAQRLAAHLEYLLSSIVSGPDISLDALEYVPAGESGMLTNVRGSRDDSRGEHSREMNDEEPQYIPPHTETEKKLAQIWTTLLGTERIGIKDDFFQLGGHSLKIMRLTGLIHQEFDKKLAVGDLFKHTVLEEQGRLIDGGNKAVFTSIQPLPKQTNYALSSSQRRLYILSQFEGGNTAYHVSGTYRLAGALRPASLEQAFGKLIERHESLRTIFKTDENGEVRQVILEPGESHFLLGVRDLYSNGNSGNYTNSASGNQDLRSMIAEETAAPFDLAHGPLLRATIYRTGERDWVFSYVMHHIISDAWSTVVFFRELLLLYDLYAGGKGQLPAELSIQYKDYAAWQQQQLIGDDEHKSYWLKQMEGQLPVLELSTDRPRPEIRSFRGGVVRKQLNLAVLKELRVLCTSQDCTLYMGLLGIVNALLYRYTGQRDLIIGSPVAGRDHADLDGQIGFYVNTLPIRVRFGQEDSFHELLKQVKTAAIGAYEHQVYPFDALVQALGLHRDLGRNALFDVGMMLQNADIDARNQPNSKSGLQIRKFDAAESGTSKFDLLFAFEEKRWGLEINLEYNSDLLDRSSVIRMTDHLELLMADIIKRPSTALAQLEYISDLEKECLLHSFNDTAVSYPSDSTVAALFEQQVKETPDNLALIFENVVYTYRQLNEKANQMAAWLRSHYAIGPDDLIGLQLERSEWLLITILGILKAGGGYVPIDTAYPQTAIDHMLQESHCKLLIDQQKLEEINIAMNNLPAEDPEPVSNARHLGYVMYTSGSTGRPKGVMVEQRSIVRLVKGTDFVPLSPKTVLLSTGAISFDATTFEYWGMLLNGGTLVLTSREVLLDPIQLRSIIGKHGVNMMWFTAGWLQQLVDEHIELFDGLKILLAGGDKLSAPHIRTLRDRYPALQIVNGYGPTENTTFSLTYPVRDATMDIPVGKPIANSTAYILDENMRLCPIGVVGEICVGGAGLARGYLHNDALTNERFVKHPFQEGQLLYKTGDLGKWLADGNIAFAGRRDDQVKIRGYRIEPGEIENVLMKHPAIDSAIVMARTRSDGDKELIAWFTAGSTGQSAPKAAVLHKYISQFLPSYLWPAYYVPMSVFPLNANGKVDRSRLPVPQREQMVSEAGYVAPRNETEQKLAAIWQEILGRDQIGVKDNFFELGGHSLKVTQMISRINHIFLVQIKIQQIFREPVLENIAAQINFILDQKKQKLNKEKLTEIEI